MSSSSLLWCASGVDEKMDARTRILEDMIKAYFLGFPLARPPCHQLYEDRLSVGQIRDARVDIISRN